jgi:AcrR family transcriptional regulator
MHLHGGAADVNTKAYGWGIEMARTKSLTVRRSVKKPPAEATRLDSQAWVRAALDILAEQGIDGVRVEILARQLGVTKGSFYWHFRDRDALFEAILDAWRRQATLRIISRLDQTTPTSAGRLQQLLNLPFQGPRAEWGANVELSLRLWSRHDPRARATLAEVDQLRLRYIAGLFEDCGHSSSDAKARAVLAYAFIRVGTTLVESKDKATLETCLSLISKSD